MPKFNPNDSCSAPHGCDTPTGCNRDGYCQGAQEAARQDAARQDAGCSKPVPDHLRGTQADPYRRPSAADLACLRTFDEKKSKAQVWAQGAQERQAKLNSLREQMMTLRNGTDAPHFDLPGRDGDRAFSPPLLAAQVTSEGGLALDCHGDDRLTADQACKLARWILETFEVPK